MTTLASMEHVLDRVQLVRGKGQRRKGHLCIMSLVALLAGERHTDAPITASPFIRHFAIALNDSMPESERERLKLFAPRILGTNDGLDAERVRLVQRAFAEEVAPRLHADLAADWLPRRLGSDWSAYVTGGKKSPQELLSTFLTEACWISAGHEATKTAAIAAKLLIMCATSTPANVDSGWYWSKAIDVLDRLCDVGPPAPGSRVSPALAARAGYILDHTGRLQVVALTASEILLRIRRRMGERLASSDLDGSLATRPAVVSAELTPALPSQSAPLTSATSRSPLLT